MDVSFSNHPTNVCYLPEIRNKRFEVKQQDGVDGRVKDRKKEGKSYNTTLFN